MSKVEMVQRIVYQYGGRDIAEVRKGKLNLPFSYCDLSRKDAAITCLVLMDWLDVGADSLQSLLHEIEGEEAAEKAGAK